MSELRLPALRINLVAVLGFAIALALAGPGSGQESRDAELMDQVRRLEKVKAQKIEADLRRTLQEVQRLPVASSARAVERLQTALAEIEADTVLSEARRQTLVRLLKDRIRVTQETATEAAADKKPQLARKRAGDAERKLAEQKKFRDALKNVEQLRTEGKTEAAARAADELTKQPVKEKEAFAADRIATKTDEVEKAAQVKKGKDNAVLASLRDVDKSSIPVKGDLEFPPDWRERTKGRSSKVQLTVKEKAILKALDAPISVNFRNSRLQDVVEYLGTVLDTTILVDMDALKDLEASYDTPITLNVKGVSARTVLRKILAEIGMSYVIRDEVIQATSHERAKKLMVARSYYIGDLIGQARPLTRSVGLQFLPVTEPAQQVEAVQAVNVIMEMIRNSVDPGSWLGNGGDGTVSFHAPSMSLMIKQSAEVHAKLANSGLVK
jgi:hypothetical protein